MKILEDTIKTVKKYRYTISVALLLVGSAVLILNTKKQQKQSETVRREVVQCDRSEYATVPIESVRLMKDLNDVQLLHAQANGLKSIYISNQSFVEDSAELVARHILTKITDNPLYRLKKLTHSYPYVTLEMAELLNDIATTFRAKLKAKNIDHYNFYVTSALRTAEFQETLSGRNKNAASESAHLYGATVDISYKDFYNANTNEAEQNALVADALRETMLDMREACRLVVVREKRQACYHFTVVNCDPAKISNRIAQGE